MALYNALIRTHHITSRKKVAVLKRATDSLSCFALLRSGGCPGIMYVEAMDKNAVESWVGVVRDLRYKDFQLVSRPASATVEEEGEGSGPAGTKAKSRAKETKRQGDIVIGLEEVDSVKEFGIVMKQKGFLGWWKRGMSYID